ncbi:FAD binding domain-containing protein [Parasitella parasitica]|nr:FAD binding domain-containing protein [Parasitella parasitica]
MSIKVDILVSGAGPVGLFFAYQMARRGHSVFIADPKTGPTDQSRAILVTARTLEVLESKGLAADILRESFVFCGMRMFQGGSVVGQIDACGDTPFGHTTVLMQGKTEEIFVERLAQDTDCKIHWETELLSYTQDSHSVKSVVRDIHTRQEQVVESVYIVGADGSHSSVRKGNPQWTYDGVAIQTKFILADLTLHGADGEDITYMMDRMNTFMTGTDVLGMIRLNPVHPTKDDSHVFRIFGNLEAYHISNVDRNLVSHGIDKTPEGPPTLDFIQEWLNKATAPLKFVASDVIWASYFRINERIANGFRKDRAFLIGDAAHCHSPAGGQGMNLGLQDAHNLAWKMSDVLKGMASHPEKLLDSYNEEREPIAKATIETTSNTTKFGLQGNALFASIRNKMLAMAIKFPSVKETAFKKLMQLYVSLDPEISSIEHQESDKGLIEAGKFLPDTAPLRKSFVTSAGKGPRRIERSSLRELLIDNEKYIVIFIATCLPSTRPNLDLIKKFWIDTRSKPVRRLVIQSAYHSTYMAKLPDFVTDEEASTAEESFYSEERNNLPNSVSNLIGLYPLLSSYFAGQRPSSVVLFVRPDIYISHARLVTNEAELDTALEFLSELYA